MEKALESLLENLPPDQIELVLISGPSPKGAPYAITALEFRSGWVGRLLAIKRLRCIARTRAEAGAVIVAVGSWAFAALAIATVLSRFKLTLWEHTFLPWRVRHEWRVTLAATAVRLLAFRLERVVCVSQSNKDFVAQVVWPLRNLTVIPNMAARTADGAINADTGGDQQSVEMVGIGSLTPRKNWKLAIRAMQHLPGNYQLRIAGNGKQHDQLLALIQELSLGKRVSLLGYVPDADRLMNTAKVVVHPSLAETFGYTMVEAAARYRPIVVLDLPAMNEMVPRFVCGERADSTSESFAAAIRRAVSGTYEFSMAERNRNKEFNDLSVVNAWASLVAGLEP
ncbi:glycosyltransferase family 4 protein [Mycobacterium sp. SMC-8]|uniref:glycosyltransferase family 4 protein n=1 Tax=Mycobacterium sp. SMC-8 TaxID=2857060 RepID=UPI0037C96EF6